MGIPKFFGYISRRYPCLTESLRDYQIPEFDNLYLDMNGIIHNCSHPDDSNVCFRISEEKIFKDMCHYVEILFRIIQPQKLFFIAIDGVAPRAKMNHQRGRRFRAAKEAEVQEAQARAKGVAIPKEKRFDSNAITPGTVFMAKLNEQMKRFIAYKMSTDKLWQRCKVIFSGSEVPGEGEHKIMDYIRYMKSQPDYDIHTRHCLYGLDTDLVMLGLCTHEVHFTLLREEITFKKQKAKAIEETKFCLFHLSLLRDYIDHEFSTVKKDLPFPYDIEKIIDDWVLMGFLVGNDFIPNLPNLHIVTGAMATLYNVYKDVLHTLGGYINEAGTLNLDRFERFMERLSQLDMTEFCERHMMQQQKFTPSPKSPTDMIKGHRLEDADDYEDDETCIVQFVEHKRDYYMKKLEYENVDADFLRSQAEGYVRAIQWNLHYYYNGCVSWSWYYPHHYAPYISDIKGFKDLNLEFELGKPFLPFQQLLAVLPSQSKDLLPKAFQTLLTEEQSPIIDYYPIQFPTDLNGKIHEWEAVVLIPFINEKELHEAMAPHYSKLTPEEVQRNKSGPMYLYLYSEKSVGKFVYDTHDIISHAKVTPIKHDDIIVPREKLVKGLCPGVNFDEYMLGFPTLQHVKHTTSITTVKGNNPHKVQSIVLYIIPPVVPNLSSIASELLGTTLYAHWPFLIEAQVVGVSNSDTKISLRNPELPYSKENIVEEELKGALSAKWISECASLTEAYKDSAGIDIGETTVLIHARPLVGKKYIFDNQGKLCLEKQWSEIISAYPYQTVVRDLKILNKSALEHQSIETVFTPGSTCFMLGHPFYGSMGKIDDPAIHPVYGRIRVELFLTEEPSFEAVQQCALQLQRPFMYGSIAAQRLGISSHVLSRVTGSIYVIRSLSEDQNDVMKHNVGLNLKLNKKNQETPGYTRRENNQWLYSTKAIDLIRDYMVKCPKMFERFAKNVLNDVFREEQLFDSSEELDDVLEWLKERLSSIERRVCGTEVLDPEIVQKIEEEVDAFLETNNDRYVLMSFHLKPRSLLMPHLYLRSSVPDQKSKNQLFDRVCCVKQSSSVPFGAKGTIIGIQKGDDAKDTIYDILFDKPFPGGLSISGSSEARAYRLSVADFLNISYGERKEQGEAVRTDLSIKSKVSRKSVVNQKPQSRVNASAFASFKKEGESPVTETPASPKLRIIKKNTEEPNKSKQVSLPTDSRNWRQSNSQNVGKESRKIVPGSQNNTASEEALKAAVIPASEYRALWIELHKKQNAYVPTEAPLASSTSTNLNQRHNKQIAKEVPKYSFQPQDPSEFLKAVLKISDNSETQPVARPGTSSVVPPKSVQPTNEASNAPRLVQQLFDHARQNEKVKDEKSPIWYCSQLLNYYQVSGVGMPRYSYFMDAETELIRAHILLPDTRIFIGDPCVTHEEAAGSAAKKAYMELNLTSIPDMKTLLLPPQQWYSNRQNVRPPVLPRYPSKIITARFSQWTPKVPQNPGFPQPPMMHPSQSKPQPKRIYNEQKCEVKNSTPFVPLQAQKKSRNISAKQWTKDTSQCAKDSNHQPDAQRKREEAVPKSKKIENVPPSPRGGEPVQSVLQQVQQKTEQSAKPKRSRVAAKFGTTVQPE